MRLGIARRAALVPCLVMTAFLMAFVVACSGGDDTTKTDSAEAANSVFEPP